MEAGTPTINFDGGAVDPERVILTKVAAITVLWNAVAAVAAALLPCLVLGLPVSCAMLLPHAPLFSLLYALPLL